MLIFFLNDLKAFILNFTLNMLSFNYLPNDSHLFIEPFNWKNHSFNYCLNDYYYFDEQLFYIV
jgi:hypothetical protein